MYMAGVGMVGLSYMFVEIFLFEKPVFWKRIFLFSNILSMKLLKSQQKNDDMKYNLYIAGWKTMILYTYLESSADIVDGDESLLFFVDEVEALGVHWNFVFWEVGGNISGFCASLLTHLQVQEFSCLFNLSLRKEVFELFLFFLFLLRGVGRYVIGSGNMGIICFWCCCPPIPYFLILKMIICRLVRLSFHTN